MSARVLGVLGGMDMDDATLRQWADSAEVLYGADSGARRLMRLGFRPVVVGDLESFPDGPLDHLRVVRVPDQSSTDVDKLLALAVQDGHTAVTLVGVEGDLPDHVLATLSSAVAAPLPVRLGLRRGHGWILRGGDAVNVPAVAGQRVSLLPLGSARVTLRGVRWPLEDAPLALGVHVSVSNEAEGPVEAVVHSGAALLFRGAGGRAEPEW